MHLYEKMYSFIYLHEKIMSFAEKSSYLTFTKSLQIQIHAFTIQTQMHAHIILYPKITNFLLLVAISQSLNNMCTTCKSISCIHVKSVTKYTCNG